MFSSKNKFWHFKNFSNIDIGVILTKYDAQKRYSL